MDWLTAKSLFNLPRWVVGLFAIALIVFGVWLLEEQERKDDKFNQEVGATVEREANTRTVLDRTELGNEVRAEAAGCAAGDDAVCHDLCMRYDSGAPESCERFLSE